MSAVAPDLMEGDDIEPIDDPDQAMLEASPERENDPNASNAQNNSLTQTPQFTYRMKMQVGRAAFIKKVAESAPKSETKTSLRTIEFYLSQLDKVYTTFQIEHEYFTDLLWPERFIEHEYFTSDVYEETTQLVFRTKLALTELKHSLEKEASRKFIYDLPTITMPKFSGKRTEWLPFRQFIDAIIIGDARLTNVEKLYYLRSCMEGDAARFIECFPFKPDALQTTWEAVIKQYENKRLIMYTHFDQILSIKNSTPNDSSSLNELMLAVLCANGVLQSLGCTWDCFLVYYVSRRLDRKTLMAWETSLGASEEYPSYKQLQEFLMTRVRVLKGIESISTTKENSSSTQPAIESATAHRTCDYCGLDHYIVTCPTFAEMSPADRYNHVATNNLCYNCLRRHKVRSCKARNCKTCGKRHHTMLHGAVEQSAVATESTS